MSNIVNNYTTTIVSIYNSVIQNYEKNVEDIKRIEDELNDINHEVELSAPKDMYKGWQMYSDIRKLRIERRQKKEENELMKELYEYLTGTHAQNFKTKMQQIQGISAKIRQMQERRTYRPRQRDDLTCKGETSTAHKPFEDMLKEFNQTKVTIRNGKLRK